MLRLAQPNARFLVIIAGLAVVAVLAAACGPAGSSAESVPFVAAIENDVDSAVPTPDSAVVVGPPAPSSFSEAAIDPTIPMGFTEDGHPYLGHPDAPVVLEEFSDFQCPFCSRFADDTLPVLMDNQITNGQVMLVFYDFPLNIHPQAPAAANAARCAAEAGPEAYWAMHDRLFVNVGEWSNGAANTVFAGYGQEMGLDEAAFAACLEENRYEAEIMADMDFGRSRGVSSTPSFFLNGQPLVGAQPVSVFAQAIEAVGGGETIAAAGPERPSPQQPAIKPTPATIVADNVAASLGDPNAAVTIVEYTDYQCPFCSRHAAETLPAIISDMVDNGLVYYQMKDFPLDQLHPEARAAAVAARCGGEQDAYWAMHDELFLRQNEWGGQGTQAAGIFLSMANDLALDELAFTECVESGRYDQVIQDNLDEAVGLGVRGTPAFFIDGFPISGAQPIDLFEYAVGLAAEGTLADAYVQPEQEAQPEPEPSGPAEVETTDSPSIGDPDAPVVIVEFTDYQCPFCSRHFKETFPQIKANYIDTGLVRYIFKDFPLDNIHPQATLAAQAGRCAGEQGAYLQMHDQLFNNQQAWAGRSDAGEQFTVFAGAMGLDTEAFEACLADGAIGEAVAADLAEGVQLGVNGTPAFFINGHFLSGAQPYEVFAQAIDQFLEASE